MNASLSVLILIDCIKKNGCDTTEVGSEEMLKGTKYPGPRRESKEHIDENIFWYSLSGLDSEKLDAVFPVPSESPFSAAAIFMQEV